MASTRICNSTQSCPLPYLGELRGPGIWSKGTVKAGISVKGGFILFVAISTFRVSLIYPPTLHYDPQGFLPERARKELILILFKKISVARGTGATTQTVFYPFTSLFVGIRLPGSVISSIPPFFAWNLPPPPTRLCCGSYSTLEQGIFGACGICSLGILDPGNELEIPRRGWI